MVIKSPECQGPWHHWETYTQCKDREKGQRSSTPGEKYSLGTERVTDNSSSRPNLGRILNPIRSWVDVDRAWGQLAASWDYLDD